jgi:PAS domain S-box-containing protein
LKQENRRVPSARVPIPNWGRLLKVFASLFVVLAIQHFSYEAVAENDAVVTAVPASFPPYYLTDKDGRPIGFAIEVMNEVARGAKVNIRYEIKKNWTAVFMAARAGEVDLIPNVGATTARRAFLDFTDPIETFAISIFTRVSESEIKAREHLIGRKVGAVAANIGLKIAKKMAGIQVTSFPSFEQAVFALFSGRIDALIYPQAVAWKAATEAGYEHRLKVAGEPLREIKRVIGVRKGEEKLFAALHASANAFLETPKYREIYQKWFAEAPPFWTDARVSWTLGGSLFVLFVVLGLWRHYVIVALKKDLDRQVEIRTAELQTSETRNRLILEAAGEGIYGLDDKGVVTFVNPAASKLLGYSADELIGWPILDIIHHSRPDGSPYPKEETPIFAAIKDGKSYMVSEEVMWRKNGEPLPVQYAITPVPSQNEIDRAVVSFSDITEIKNRELALKRSNSELESFAYVASHDLQEPLRKIQAFSERLEINYKDDLDARGRDYISRIVDSTIRMRELIEGLLVLSGVSHKGGKPQKIKLDDMSIAA